MKPFNIMAPISSVNEVEPVINAGATEIYFGIMTKSWTERFGNADFISRRQSEFAHISEFNELSEIVESSNRYNCKATLVLNARYSENQLPYVFEILEEWEKRGGHSVMTADMEILLWLMREKSRLERQLSIMAGVFNHHSVDFFKHLQISRVVIPRENSIREITGFMQFAPSDVEYEIIVMLQKCEFIDSFCNFYHAFNYQLFVVNDYRKNANNLPVIACHDPCYEGHGCQLAFTCGNRKIIHRTADEIRTPVCAACSLEKFREFGIANYKIAGRGYPLEIVVKSVQFVKRILVHFDFQNSITDFAKKEYASVFGNNCSTQNCYYR